jgi:hypothetical protein
MYGVASQMLRRRLTDALALTRRAIEATATAYRLWKNPQLIEVFLTAYPNANETNHPKQWKRSRQYSQEFSTHKLFNEPGDTWDRMRVYYEVFSAMASHAGPGATIHHEFRGRQRYLSFLPSNDQDIRRSWYYLLAAYMDMWKVFLHILRGACPVPVVEMLERDFITWRDGMSVIRGERAPRIMQG